MDKWERFRKLIDLRLVEITGGKLYIPIMRISRKGRGNGKYEKCVHGDFNKTLEQLDEDILKSGFSIKL